MKNKKQLLAVTGFDIAIASILGLGLAALFNVGKILMSYGYGSSVDTLHHEVGGGVIGLLSRIDDFRFTTSIVSFLIWAIIGMVTLFIISSLLKGADTIRQNLDFVGPAYVKPASFKKQEFLHTQILNIVALVVGFVVLLTVLTLLLKGTWPYANTMIRHINSGLPVWRQAVDAIIGCIVYVVSIGVIMYIGRLTIRRQILLS